MKLFCTSNHHKNIRAFTLLEVLASLSIVTLVILGPLTSSINSSAYSKQSKDLMVSLYLAEESLELLRHQYDTLYIACANDKDACEESVFPTVAGETSGGKAWRLFKTRLNDSSVLGTVSCFDTDGCSYDFLDMMEASSVTPPKKYDPTSTECPSLSMVQSAPYGELYGIDTGVRNYYVCSSIDQTDINDRLKDNHFNVSKTTYTRSIFVESKPTFTEANPPSSPANLGLYQDDLVVTSTVSFRRSNGLVRSITVTDFFHAR